MIEKARIWKKLTIIWVALAHILARCVLLAGATFFYKGENNE